MNEGEISLWYGPSFIMSYASEIDPKNNNSDSSRQSSEAAPLAGPRFFDATWREFASLWQGRPQSRLYSGRYCGHGAAEPGVLPARIRLCERLGDEAHIRVLAAGYTPAGSLRHHPLRGFGSAGTAHGRWPYYGDPRIVARHSDGRLPSCHYRRPETPCCGCLPCRVARYSEAHRRKRCGGDDPLLRIPTEGFAGCDWSGSSRLLLRSRRRGANTVRIAILLRRELVS